MKRISGGVGTISMESDFKFYAERSNNIGKNIDNLLRLASRIELTGTVKDSYALEAIEITGKPSLSKDHKVALEELSGGIMALIAAAIAALVALVYKFIKWAFGDSSSSGGNGGAMAKIDKEKVIAAKDHIGKAEEAHKEVVHACATKRVDISNFDKIIHDYVNDKANSGSNVTHILKQENNEYFDILSEGPYYKAMMSCYMHCTNDVKAISKLFDLDNKASIMHDADGVNSVVLEIKNFKLASGDSVSDKLIELEAAKNSISGSNVTLSFNDLYKHYLNFNSNLDKILDLKEIIVAEKIVVEQIEAKIKKLGVEMDRDLQSGVMDDAPAEIKTLIPSIKELITEMRSLLIHVLKYLHILVSYVNKNVEFFNHVITALGDCVGIIEREVKKEKDTVQVQEALAKLRGYLVRDLI